MNEPLTINECLKVVKSITSKWGLSESIALQHGYFFGFGVYLDSTVSFRLCRETISDLWREGKATRLRPYLRAEYLKALDQLKKLIERKIKEIENEKN